jgi:hypothetical protein
VPPGKTNVEVDVFEPTKEADTISVGSRIVFFQPNGANLIVGEEYSIDNKSQPPRAYFRTDGNFEFSLPDNAQLQQVAASGPAGMPVVQAPIDKSKNHYAIAYAFRPGQSTVRYSYEIPYPGNAASLRVPMIYSASRLIVVAPPTMQVSGEGLQPGGQEQGMSIYGRENVAAGKAIAVSISGTAPPPAADNGQDAAPQGRDAQQAGEGGGISIQQVPGRLDDLKWPLLGVLAVGFALGAFLLSRKSVVSVPVGPQMQSESLASAGFTASSKSNTPPSAALAELDAAVGTSLDALKERIFRLELRRQAGTISEEEYGQERAKAEQVLRDLVRG